MGPGDLDPHLVVEILAQSLDTKASAEMRWTPLEAARLAPGAAGPI